jgi:hypothetical protein
MEVFPVAMVAPRGGLASTVEPQMTGEETRGASSGVDPRLVARPHRRGVPGPRPRRPAHPRGERAAPPGGPHREGSRRRGVQAGQEPAHQRPRQRPRLSGRRRRGDRGPDRGLVRRHPPGVRPPRARRALRGDPGAARARGAGRDVALLRSRAAQPGRRATRRRCPRRAAARPPSPGPGLRRHPRGGRSGVRSLGSDPGSADDRGCRPPRHGCLQRVHRTRAGLPPGGPGRLSDRRVRAVQD